MNDKKQDFEYIHKLMVEFVNKYDIENINVTVKKDNYSYVLIDDSYSVN